jgi:hypothetical protein
MALIASLTAACNSSSSGTSTATSGSNNTGPHGAVPSAADLCQLLPPAVLDAITPGLRTQSDGARPNACWFSAPNGNDMELAEHSSTGGPTLVSLRAQLAQPTPEPSHPDFHVISVNDVSGLGAGAFMDRYTATGDSAHPHIDALSVYWSEDQYLFQLLWQSNDGAVPPADSLVAAARYVWSDKPTTTPSSAAGQQPSGPHGALPSADHLCDLVPQKTADALEPGLNKIEGPGQCVYISPDNQDRLDVDFISATPTLAQYKADILARVKSYGFQVTTTDISGLGTGAFMIRWTSTGEDSFREVAWSEDQTILVARWYSHNGTDVSADALVAIARNIWQN